MNDASWRTLRSSTVIALTGATLAGSAWPSALRAQHEAHGAALKSAAARLGDISFANSGTPAAQPAFIRGLALLHNFQYPQAAAAFREAQTLDPGFAMAYWGEAMTYNHGVWKAQDSVAARAVLQRLGATPAERLAKAPTAREKDYLRTLDVLYSAPGTKEARDSAYATATAQLAARYPSDVDAQLFHALALLSLFPRTDSTYMRAAAIAEQVMRDHPQHPGALHYVIHAYDDPTHATRGLAAARGYSTVAPDAPHAQHMTSHIFIALGMWDDVVRANEVAIHTNEDERGSAAVATAMCTHPGLWLQYGYLQQGRFADARRMMDGCRAGSATSADMAHGYATMRVRYLVDVDQPPPEIAAVPSVQPTTPGERSWQDFGTAWDAARRGDTARVVQLLDQMRQTRARFDASPVSKSAPERGSAMAVREDEIRALMLVRRGSKDDAVALLRSAAQREDALPFMFGPPMIEKPSRELLGEVLLQIGRPADARHELELSLKRTPGRSVALLDLARADAASGDSAAARAAYQQLGANWHRADPTIPALGEVRGAAPKAGPELTRDQSIAFSVLPLPDTLRAGAGVVAFDAQRHAVTLRQTSNGMICARFVPGEDAWDARCYHQSFTPLFFRSLELRAEGLKPADITVRMADEIGQGKLHAPAHATAGYRVLGAADSYDPALGVTTNEMRFWQSIHMPFRTAQELGLPDEFELPGKRRATMPFVMASGTWWAHVMIMHEKAADGRP
jgi:tetratricopeptide (TPR) repeat protein